jgi:hypothetical protein
MPDRLSPTPEFDPQIIWHGQPETRVRGPDVGAAIVAVVATFAVLTSGLAAQNEWAWPWAARLAAGYAALVGLIVAFARAAGAGMWLMLGSAFCAVVAAGAINTNLAGLAGLCPLMALGAAAALVALRFRQRRNTRYQVTGEQVLLGERGGYTIAFPLQALPDVHLDPFGASLGTVEFGPVDATLTTRDGKVFRLTAKLQVFRRVLHPERLLEALRALESGDSGGTTP